MNKLFKIFCLTMITFSWAFASSNLEWESWILGKRLMDVSVDDGGHIKGVLYKDGREIKSKYYYTARDYTCAETLKDDFGADCSHTCFPSYNQKGIDFYINLSEGADKTCSQKTQSASFLGFKGQLQEITCPEGKIELTVLPEFGKYQELINKGTNDYFRKISETFKVKGFIAQVKMEGADKKVLQFYEVKNLKLKSGAAAITLPSGYAVVPNEPFLSQIAQLEKKVTEEANKKLKELSSKEDAQTKLELLAIKNDCKVRFPAQKDDSLVMELCRQDPTVKEKIDVVIGKWQERVRGQVNPEIQKKFGEGTAKIIESSCKQ